MRLTAFVFTLFVVFSCQPKELPTIAMYKEDGATVKLSHQTTKAEMEKIQEKMAEQYDMEMVFDQSTFFDDGRLRELKLGIRSMKNDGGGSLSAKLTTLQYTYYGFEVIKDEQGFMVKKTGAI